MDTTQFLTPVPFPSIAKNLPGFDPQGYWRGPVWLDQAYFAISGLLRYNFTTEAYTALSMLLNNTEGLQVSIYKQ